MKKILKIKEEKGITLVALVVTIIILLILAGIGISVLTQTGLLKKAQVTAEISKEKNAKEKLQMELITMSIEKMNNKEYNSNEYLTKKLQEKNFKVNDDIIEVDNYLFIIDRETLQILTEQGKENKDIKIMVTQTLSEDYKSSILNIEIEYNENIKCIKISGEELILPEKVNGKYKVKKEIKTNGKYNICVINEINEINIETIEVTEILENINIKTAEELVKFRNKVNNGYSYEGLMVTLENDIDLSNICYKVDGTIEKDISWTPIGTSTNPFKGTFNGNSKQIKNLYINTEQNYQGLFAYTLGATIEGVTIDENSNIIANSFVSAIVANANNTTIKKCVNKANVNSKSEYIGGICAIDENASTIQSCYNSGTIISDSYAVGGISGNNISGIIEYCYNTGNITSNGETSRGYNNVAGISGYNSGYIKYCYNIGIITGSRNGESYSGDGLIVGQQLDNNSAYTNYSYALSNHTYPIIGHKINGASEGCEKIVDTEIKNWSEETIEKNLTNKFTKDKNNINNSYPVLSWQNNEN